MTLRTLASLIAKREGKKHEATISDIREIIKIIIEMDLEFYKTADWLNGPMATMLKSVQARKTKSDKKKTTSKKRKSA